MFTNLFFIFQILTALMRIIIAFNPDFVTLAQPGVNFINIRNSVFRKKLACLIYYENLKVLYETYQLLIKNGIMYECLKNYPRRLRKNPSPALHASPQVQRFTQICVLEYHCLSISFTSDHQTFFNLFKDIRNMVISLSSTSCS